MVQKYHEILEKGEKCKKSMTSINEPLIFYFPSYFENSKINKKTKMSYPTQEFHDTKTRQNIRYRATATLRRLQINQYTASNEGGIQNQREHVVFHPTAVSENYSSSGMLRILINAQTVSILSNIFA